MTPARSPRHLPRRAVALALVVAAVAAAAAGLQIGAGDSGKSQSAAENPFDGTVALKRLEAICALGPRVTGSEAMRLQREMLTAHFQKLGAVVRRQEAPPMRHPQTGAPTEVVNLIASWHPDRKERILLCCHYDTRPYPDRDPVDPQGLFLGANDGASGAAVLMTLGESMDRYPGPFGVDFVFFDAEELVYSERDEYFVGSTYFAEQYAARAADAPRYRAGVLLDMVGASDLRLLKDNLSQRWNDTRPLVDEIWGVARRLGVREFVSRTSRQAVRDDHLPLHEIGEIPVCDVIQSFPWRYWHTRGDVPAACSADSLAKVGWVLKTWLFEHGAESLH